MDFSRRRPSPETLNWVERMVAGKVVAWRRMTGGIVTAVHRLTVESGGQSSFLVLRQMERGTAYAVSDIEQEAYVLVALRGSGLPAPELIAASPDGAETGGDPSILMTRLPGHVHLMPEYRDEWLSQIAHMCVRIHETKVSAPAFRNWLDPTQLTVPASASRPKLWQELIEALQQPGNTPEPCFIHRDFQHFNVLWLRSRLAGVVDWGMACAGPPDVDVGHCRLNLAVLFGADVAKRFLSIYEAQAGRSVDPWWDLHEIAIYDDSWRQFIPVQAAGLAVDTAGMTSRVEDLLDAALRRL